jgi:NADPH-dependent curcumin reductase
VKNRQIWLCSRPNGIPRAVDFAVREADMSIVSDGDFLVRNQFLSADPAMRGWIADTSTYWPRIVVGGTMRAFSVGEVIESRNPAYAVDDKVMGIFGWQDYAAVKQQQVMRGVLETDLPLSLSLGVLGLNGLTAYFGLLDVCRPKAGETVVVSTAAGESALRWDRSRRSGDVEPSDSPAGPRRSGSVSKTLVTMRRSITRRKQI